MKQYKDKAIVLHRIEYGERDRILTLLCGEHGKVSVLAKGVRSEKSRLAGGIELLSESEVTFLDGRSSLKTLTAARLRIHYGNLTTDVRRMQQAFSYIKAINTVSEEGGGQEYYQTLLQAFETLNNTRFDHRIVDIWFNLHIMQSAGTVPNLSLEAAETALHFEFDYDNQRFQPRENGIFTRNDLKLMRVCLTQPKPPKIQNQLGSEDRLAALTQTLLKSNVTEL